MIYQSITETMFRDAFRSLRPDNFSYDGLSALYNYLTDLSDDCGDIELDVIAICCDFSQECSDDIMTEHDITLEQLGLDSDATSDEEQEAVAEWLSDHTTVIGSFEDGTILFQVF